MPSITTPGRNMLIIYNIIPSIRNVPKPNVNTIKRNETYDNNGHINALTMDNNETTISAI